MTAPSPAPSTTSPATVAQPRVRVVSAPHRDLITDHQDLPVLGCIGAGEQYQPAQHTGEDQVCESEGPRREIMRPGLWPVTARLICCPRTPGQGCATVLGSHRP